MLLQRPKISFSSRVAFTSIREVLGRPVRSSTWMPVQPFSNSLHHFPSRYTHLIPPPYDTSTNWRWISILEKLFSLKYHIALQTSSRDRVCYVAAIALQVTPSVASDGLTLESSVACYLYYKCYLLPKNKILGWNNSYRLGYLYYWTSSIIRSAWSEPDFWCIEFIQKFPFLQLGCVRVFSCWFLC
jgi:hypothetical protein